MNTVLEHLNQFALIAIIALAIIIAVLYVLNTKHKTTTIEPVVRPQMFQIAVAAVEEDKTSIMDKYAICFENNQYVWGTKSFKTLEDAINNAEAFIDRISVDYRLPIQAF